MTVEQKERKQKAEEFLKQQFWLNGHTLEDKNGTQLSIQSQVRELLNNSNDFLSEQTAQSPRAAGDAIESIVEESFERILGEYCGEYSSNFLYFSPKAGQTTQIGFES